MDINEVRSYADFIDAVNRINGKQTGKARFKIGDKVGLGKDSIQNTTWSRKKI